MSSSPGSPLIEPLRLAALLSEHPPPAVLDVRWRLGAPSARPDHDAAHIPGAVFLELDADLAAPPGQAGRHPLPDPAALQAVLRRAGVRRGGLVVAHDDGNGSIAARAWWLLRWAGFPAHRVAVLNGGWAAWVAAGLPTTADPSAPEAGDAVVEPGGMPVLDADGAAALARSGVLLDARAAPRYRGDVEPVDPRAGHIPGAHNLPATELVGADGRFRPPAELAARLTALGAVAADSAAPDSAAPDSAAPDSAVPDSAAPGSAAPGSAVPGSAGGAEVAYGAYCGSGVTATALVLAAEYAGVRPPERPVPVYVGSWSHWSGQPGRPVATGADPATAGGDR